MAEIASCEICGGTGWEIIQEGTVERARRCACSASIDRDKLAGMARIPARYSSCEFETYVPNGLYQTRTKSLLMNFAADYPLLDEDVFRERSLLLSGGAGRGKTHLAIAVLKALMNKGVPCLFIDFHELLTEIRGSYDELSQTSEYQLLRPLTQVEVLLLDDLGSQRMTEWMKDTIFYIINLRYNHKRPIIATTNLGMEPLKSDAQETLQDRLGYRVVSRLYEMCTCLELDGPDYRKEVRKAGSDEMRKRKS